MGSLGLKEFVASFIRTAAATGLMALATWGAMEAADRFGPDPASSAYALTQLMAGVVAGAAAFALTARLLRMSELADILSRRRKMADETDRTNNKRP